MRHVIAPIAVAVLAASLEAAPNLKSSTIDGELKLYGGRDAVLVRKERTPEGEFIDVTYWLVFTSEGTETDAKKIGEGELVVVTGTMAHGGQYRYVIVEKVTKGK